MTEYRFVSDVHLGALHAAEVKAEADRCAARFASFVRSCAGRGDELRLVLLGDVFDLLESVPVPAHRRETPPRQQDLACSALDDLHRRHPEVFAALGEVARGGGGIDVVAGNHDPELMLPLVQQRLLELLGPGALVRFHPWFLRVGGTFHAEHGHLHHDVNRIAEPLGPAGGALRLPMASHLPPRDASVRRRLAALVPLARAAARSADPRRHRRHRDYLRLVVAPRASELGVPPEVAEALLAASATTPVAMAARLVRKALRRPGPSAPAHSLGYLHGGAQRTHDVLRRAGLAVPFYVFGHTHLAESLPLDGAGYLNCGTWSPFIPAGVVDRRPAYVSVVTEEGRPPVASVERWASV